MDALGERHIVTRNARHHGEGQRSFDAARPASSSGILDVLSGGTVTSPVLQAMRRVTLDYLRQLEALRAMDET